MKINRAKNTKVNIVFGYIQKLLSVLFPFAIRTIIINTIGIQYLGLNSLFSSVLNILSLAELGFGTAMVYSMYKPIAEDDTETINALLNVYKKIYRIVGTIVLVVGLAITPVLPYLIKGSYPADINLYILYFIYLGNNVIGYFFFAYKNSLLSAHQRNDIASKINIIINSLMYVIQIVVLLLFKNYYIYIIFIPLSTLAMNLSTAFITKKMYPQYFCKGTPSKEIKADIKKKIIALITHKIGYIIQSSIDNICISAFLGLTLLGRYNNYMYIVTAVEGFITIIKQSMLAGIGNSIIVEDKEYNKKQFYKYLTVFNWIAIWCSVCFMCLFQPFIKIWTGTENMLPITVVICLTFMFYCSSIRNAIGVYKDALGLWWEDRFKPIAISIVNLIGTIISAYFGCFEGVILSTAFAYLLVGLPWETHVFYKSYMNEKQTKYYLKQLLSFVIMLICVVSTYFITTSVGSLIKYTSTFNGILEIITILVICAIVPNLITLLILYLTGQIDKDNFKSKVKKYMRKIKSILKRIYYKVPRVIKSKELLELNKNYSIYLKLKKKYSKFIKKNIACENKTSKYVFTCWLQGEENAPELVKACINSMRKNLKNREIVVITAENMKDFVEFPSYIIEKWQKGIITNTHFSDILRSALLAKHGGLWLDATVLCTGDITKYINNDTELFVFSNEHRRNDVEILSSWLIYAKPNNPIIVNTLNLLYKYWEKKNKLCDYFLFHKLFTICAKALPEEWAKVPFFSNINPHVIWFYEFFKPFNKNRFEDVKKMSNFHKLSYKFDKNDLQKGSFYEYLIEARDE